MGKVCVQKEDDWAVGGFSHESTSNILCLWSFKVLANKLDLFRSTPYSLASGRIFLRPHAPCSVESYFTPEVSEVHILIVNLTMALLVYPVSTY